jgi:hypothetical protein
MSKTKTNETTREILGFLFTEGVFAWRENVLPVPVVRAGAVTSFRSGSKAGKPDIMGILPHVGRTICCEIKTGKDRLRPEQVGFLETARKMGALVMVVKDYEDFLRRWREYKNG